MNFFGSYREFSEMRQVGQPDRAPRVPRDVMSDIFFVLCGVPCRREGCDEYGTSVRCYEWSYRSMVCGTDYEVSVVY